MWLTLKDKMYIPLVWAPLTLVIKLLFAWVVDWEIIDSSSTDQLTKEDTESLALLVKSPWAIRFGILEEFCKLSLN